MNLIQAVIECALDEKKAKRQKDIRAVKWDIYSKLKNDRNIKKVYYKFHNIMFKTKDGRFFKLIYVKKTRTYELYESKILRKINYRKLLVRNRLVGLFSVDNFNFERFYKIVFNIEKN